jgi:hypothetical protein
MGNRTLFKTCSHDPSVWRGGSRHDRYGVRVDQITEALFEASSRNDRLCGELGVSFQTPQVTTYPGYIWRPLWRKRYRLLIP